MSMVLKEYLAELIIKKRNAKLIRIVDATVGVTRLTDSS